MIKSILGFLLFIFCLGVLIVMLTGSYILKKFKDLRKAAEDAKIPKMSYEEWLEYKKQKEHDK